MTHYYAAMKLTSPEDMALRDHAAGVTGACVIRKMSKLNNMLTLLIKITRFTSRFIKFEIIV